MQGDPSVLAELRAWAIGPDPLWRPARRLLPQVWFTRADRTWNQTHQIASQ